MNKVAVTPVQRFRTALASPKSTIHHLERLAARLEADDIRAPDARGVTSLAIAAAAGNLEVCEWLMFDEGHDEGEISRDSAGETIVHIAASHGFTAILDLYLSQYPFVVDWVDTRGATPLHIAAMKGELEAAQMLIDYAGADIIDAPDLYGNTPLHCASSWGKLPVVKLLVEMDCDVSAKNNEGFTAADYAFSFQGLRALDEYVRAHAEAAKRQHRSRKHTSPKVNRALRHVPSSVMSNADAADPHSSGSIPTASEVGLGFAFDPNAPQAQGSPTRSLRPQASPTQQRSPSQRSAGISPSNSASLAPLATPPPTASGSRPATPAAASASASRPSSRPTTPSLSPLSLKRLGRNPSSSSTLAPGPPSPAADSIRKIALRDAGNIESFRYEHGGAANATIKAPARSRSHSALPGEEGNDLVPVGTPSRSASLKVERGGGAVARAPLPLPLALQGRSRSESNHSQVSSGSSIATASRGDSTLSSPARSRSNSTAQPSQPLFPPSSNTGFQPSPPPSPNTAAQTIAGVFKSSSTSKKEKERERKGSVSTVGGEADARARSGSNESQVSGGRVARALGLGRRQHSSGA